MKSGTFPTLPNLFRDYKKAIKSLDPQDKIKEVRIGGSFGRKDTNPDSDLDTWLIYSDLPPFSDIVDLSNAELETRTKLGKKYKLTSLGRHRCTIFSQKEADLYERCFSVRVGVPRSLGESISLWGKSPIVIESAPNSDIIISLREFEEHKNRALARGDDHLSRKYARRSLRELLFYRDGIRHVNNRDIDDIIMSEYGDNDEKVFLDSKIYLESLSKITNQNTIFLRDLAHKLLFTMEKLRWELIRGLTNPPDLENWARGKIKKHAFFPKEIITLVDKAQRHLGTSGSREINFLKGISSGKITLQDISKFHDCHSSWMANNALLAAIHSDKNDKS